MSAVGRLSIALLGATGNSGIQVMQQALDRGHKVKALVRSPEKVSIRHENLEVVESDIYDCQSLTDGFKGCDVVISCLGSRTFSIPRGTSFYLDTMRVITAAMRENGIKRVLTITSWGTYRDSRSPMFIEYFLRFVISSVLTSMREMELYLTEECSDLDFAVIRPAALSDDPPSGGTIRVEEECPCVPQGWCEHPSFRISRADVAKFMLDSAEKNYYRKVAIAIAV